MAGDDGFDAFFGAHYDRIVRVLAMGWGDVSLAEEAAQEAFARALRRWSRVRAMDRPDGWVYVTAVNVLRRTSRPRPDEPIVGDGHWDADPADRVVTRVAIRDVVRTLSPRQRQVVVLRYLASLSTTEVAEAMGCATGTVKSTLFQALRAMRVELEDDDAS